MNRTETRTVALALLAVVVVGVAAATISSSVPRSEPAGSDAEAGGGDAGQPSEEDDERVLPEIGFDFDYSPDADPLNQREDDGGSGADGNEQEGGRLRADSAIADRRGRTDRRRPPRRSRLPPPRTGFRRFRPRPRRGGRRRCRRERATRGGRGGRPNRDRRSRRPRQRGVPGVARDDDPPRRGRSPVEHARGVRRRGG